MSTYTYRVEESHHPRLMSIFVTMINGHDCGFSASREDAEKWCKAYKKVGIAISGETMYFPPRSSGSR